MPSKDGKMETKVYPDNPENWSKILPNTLGKTIYTHYVENPLPRFTNPDWVTLYKEQGVRFYGSEYQIEKNTMSYRDGYATFWMRITYPWKDQNFSAAVYQVKMDVPNKKVQTLSMTEYDYDGKVRSHGAGSRDRGNIEPDTPMYKVYEYVNHALRTGQLKMVTTRHG